MKRASNTTLSTIFVFLFCLTTTGLSGQNSSWNPEFYYGIPRNFFTSTFNEQFDNNNEGWNLNQKGASADIREGDLHLSSRNNNGVCLSRFSPLSEKSNYEIELQMRYVRGGEDQPFGLAFGADHLGQRYEFLINANGQCQVRAVTENGVQAFTGWMKQPLFGRYVYNIITLRKINDSWFFFLNRTKVLQMKAQDFFGFEFGVAAWGDVTTEFDYLTIHSIRKSDIIPPAITLETPFNREGDVFYADLPHQAIKGYVKDQSGIASLTINGNVVIPDITGFFSANLELGEGENAVEIEAKDFFDNSSKEAFVINYHTPRNGHNYLLLIGIDHYEYWNPLHNATKDCRDIQDVPARYYNFDARYTIMC
ncbi:MAG: hypothetical protein R3B47_14630 [Bacteroidia bacterium]